MSFPRYPAYKDSGVEWLIKIPAHWSVKRLKFIADVHSGVAKGRDLTGRKTVELPYLRVANVQDGYLDLSDVALIELDDQEVERYLLQAGDVLMNEGGDFDKLGRGYVWNNEITPCVHQNHVFAVRPYQQGISYWINLVTQSAYAKQYFISRAKQSTNLASISSSNISELPVVMPPVDEQHAIAAFLDAETARIDALVARQEGLIATLREKRRALISHAVTKGLDPSAPMKDSGVPWLGEVPAHWEMKRLKFIAEVRTGVAKGRDLTGYETVELPYLRVANVQDGYLDLSNVAMITLTKDEVERYLLKVGDVLMNEGGDYDKLGRGYVWQAEIDPCAHQNHVFAVRLHDTSCAYWVNLVAQSDYAKKYFISRSKQSTNLASISSSNISEWTVVLPPPQEQSRILAFVQTETAVIDTLIAKAEQFIALLREHRAALIAAAVTGQIDVQGYIAGEEAAHI